jgi:hypothetical protein
MFLFYTGLPGSGKSYRVVKDLIEAQNKKSGPTYYVLHNIDGLKTDSFNDPDLIKDWRDYIQDGTYKDEIELFSEETQAELCSLIREKYNLPMLIVIDEAHRWFDRDKKPLKSWVSFHRHLGQDIWMVTQKRTMIHSAYRGLAEYEKRAKNTSFFDNPFFFMYQKEANGEKFGMEIKRKSKRVFQAYKSFEANHKKTISLTIPIVLLVILVGGVAFWQLSMGGQKSYERETVKTDKPKQAVKVQQSDRDKKSRPTPGNKPVPKAEAAIPEQPARPGYLYSLQDIPKKIIKVGRCGNEIIVRDLDTGRIAMLTDIDPYLQVKRIVTEDIIDLHDKYTDKFVRIVSGKFMRRSKISD